MADSFIELTEGQRAPIEPGAVFTPEQEVRIREIVADKIEQGKPFDLTGAIMTGPFFDRVAGQLPAKSPQSGPERHE